MILPNDPVTSDFITRVTEACRDEPQTRVLGVVAARLKLTIREYSAVNHAPEGFTELVALLDRVLFVRPKDGAVVDVPADPAASALAQRVMAACRDEPLFRKIVVLGMLLMAAVLEAMKYESPGRNHEFFSTLHDVIGREVLLPYSDTRGVQ